MTDGRAATAVPAVRVQGLEKSYKDVSVLRGIDFEMQRGAIFALLGSILYLVGTALLYGSYATLDIVLLSRRVHMEPATLVAATLMTIGLFAKTALFPLHLWLPPAHAGAPAAASAIPRTAPPPLASSASSTICSSTKVASRALRMPSARRVARLVSLPCR